MAFHTNATRLMKTIEGDCLKCFEASSRFSFMVTTDLIMNQGHYVPLVGFGVPHYTFAICECKTWTVLQELLGQRRFL